MSTFGNESLPGNIAGYHALGLAALIPGYLGYHRRDGRRDADQELRRHILGRIERVKGRIADKPEGVDHDEAVDAVRRLDALADRMNSTGSRLEAFFNAGDLSEPEVDEICAYDRRIVDHLDAMEAAPRVTPKGEWSRHLDRLDQLVDERTATIERVGR